MFPNSWKKGEHVILNLSFKLQKAELKLVFPCEQYEIPAYCIFYCISDSQVSQSTHLCGQMQHSWLGDFSGFCDLDAQTNMWLTAFGPCFFAAGVLNTGISLKMDLSKPQADAESVFLRFCGEFGVQVPQIVYFVTLLVSRY